MGLRGGRARASSGDDIGRALDTQDSLGSLELRDLILLDLSWNQAKRGQQPLEGLNENLVSIKEAGKVVK